MAGINREHIDTLLGNFFFGCNIPFVIVGSIHFRRFVEALNPNYVPPTRKTLSNSILNESYNRLQRSIAVMRTRDAELLLDGWKNSSANTQNVVGILRLDDLGDRKYVFLNSWNFSTLRETGEALRDVVNECIGMARERYNVNVFAVITDNAANMKRMGRLADIWHTTCNSHSANLLAKSTMDEQFARQVNNLLKEFKKPALEGRLVEQEGNRIVIIGETRWCSHRDAMRRCLRNLDLMREISMVPDARRHISEPNYIFLHREDLAPLLQYNLLMLDPICELTNACQRADCSAAEAVEMWLRLQVPGLDDNIDQMIQERLALAINVYGLAANYLHPRFRGRGFAQNQQYMNQVNRFFNENLSPNGLIQLEAYVNGEDIFRQLLNRDYQSGIVFWRAAQPIFPELSELALKLQILCASTGQLERLFSEWSYVHSARRNRLTAGRSSKLVAIYFDTRLHDDNLMNILLNDIDDDDFDEE